MVKKKKSKGKTEKKSAVKSEELKKDILVNKKEGELEEVLEEENNFGRFEDFSTGLRELSGRRFEEFDEDIGNGRGQLESNIGLNSRRQIVREEDGTESSADYSVNKSQNDERGYSNDVRDYQSGDLSSSTADLRVGGFETFEDRKNFRGYDSGQEFRGGAGLSRTDVDVNSARGDSVQSQMESSSRKYEVGSDRNRESLFESEQKKYKIK